MKIILTSGILTSLPGRYAHALFDLAQSKEEREKVNASLKDLVVIIHHSKHLRRMLENSTLARTEQAEALIEICRKMETPKIFQLFVKQLVEMGRIQCLETIERIYEGLLYQEKNEQHVEITSAFPLTGVQKNHLKHVLKKIHSKTILSFTFTNDAKLLGGIMIRIGHHIIDAALKTQLHKLATLMKRDPS